jgi:hypothetical protein
VLRDGAGYVKLRNGQPNLTAEAKSPFVADEFVGKERTVLTISDYPIGRLSITSIRKTPLLRRQSRIGRRIFPKGYPKNE